jgi:hypothetical protein
MDFDDEDLLQMCCLSDKVAGTVLAAYKTRFRRFDSYERTIVVDSLLKVILCTLKSVERAERVRYIEAFISELNKVAFD